MLVAPKIHKIPIPGSDPAHVSNVYLIGEGEVAVLDPGSGQEDAILNYLATLGNPRVVKVIVTHSHQDHCGGAPKIQQATGAEILGPLTDLPYINETMKTAAVDIPLKDGETIEVGSVTLKVIHTPGHTPGHIALFMEAEKILFPADNVVGTGTTAIPPSPQGDMFDYVNSLRKLLALESRLICSGHGPIIENPREKIESLIHHRQARENQVIDALKGGKETPYDIMLSIYEKEIEPRLYRAAEGQVISHLIKLEKEGKVKGSEREGKKYYLLV